MACDISSLSPEILTCIFQFLKGGDRLKASQVCKKWLQTINCPKLLCDVQIKFSVVDEAVKLFSHMTRQFQWFSFCEIVIGDSVFEFLEKYSNQLVTLFFIDCVVGVGKLQSNFKGKKLRCDNLTTLHALNSDIYTLFASLPNVTELKLLMGFDVSDDVISELTKCLFKLEKLLLKNTVIFMEDSCKRLFAGQENSLAKVFPFTSIKLLMEKNRTTLRHVDFAFLRFSPQTLLSISEIEGLKLRSVLFPRNLHSSYIQKFCEMQSSLIHLDLSFLLHDTDLTVCAVCNWLPNLQELIIKENPAIDRSISKIFQLQNLVKLDVSDSMNISKFSYQEAVANLKTFKLKCLNLHLAKISDDSLFNLLKCNQNIRYLDASGIRVSDETLNMICQNLTYLECLILESCPTISDSGLTGEFENYSDSITATPLSNLRYLKVLMLSLNSLITNQGCIKAIRFRRLTNLSLIACRALILNIYFEMELKKQNPCLRNFKASN